MKPAEARKHFRELVVSYFGNANVVFGRQSNKAKTMLPLVAIVSGNVKRTRDSCSHNVQGTPVYYYPSSIDITLDLFTHGTPIVDNGMIVSYDDTAVDDLVGFINYLGSRGAEEWCNSHDLSVIVSGDVQSLSGIVNDTSYEYRARAVFSVHFTQVAVGNSAGLSAVSILYPTGQFDPETGQEIYAPYTPDSPGSGETPGVAPKDDPDDGSAVIVPVEDENSAGGIPPAVAADEAAYFTEAYIKEVRDNE